ncbi:MAG TPA: WecB/TagA/CpsF family glycosyltransferase [Patescibacteria group bacterium]
MEKTKNSQEQSWNLWGVRLNEVTSDEVLEKVDRWIGNGEKGKWLATINPEFVMAAAKDPGFLEILKKTDLNVIDGIGLIWAGEILKSRTKGIQRWLKALETGVKILQGEESKKIVAGADLIDRLCGMASEKGYSVFFLGGWGDRSVKTANHFQKKYPQLKVAGSYGGRADKDVADDEKLTELFKKGPDILFVAYGMKRQEEWIARNLEKTGAGAAMGVGRSFDYYSGDLKRAPESWRKAGFEWLYSLIKEPKRIKRQLQLPKFVWKVMTGK